MMFYDVTSWSYVNLDDPFAERVLREISSACVNTKPRGTEATCIVCGNWGQLRVRSRVPSASNKSLIAVAWKQGDSNVVRTSLRTQSTTELNQKLTKHSLKTLDTGRLQEGGGNTYVRTWG